MSIRSCGRAFQMPGFPALCTTNSSGYIIRRNMTADWTNRGTTTLRTTSGTSSRPTHSYVDVDTGEKVEYEGPWNQGDCYEIRFMSEAYDKYLKAMVDAHAIHGDELSPVYSAKTVYSNIDGGLGCFGGEWITTINISTGY